MFLCNASKQIHANGVRWKLAPPKINQLWKISYVYDIDF